MSLRPDEVRALAVFCPNLVGDAAMATPALLALRRGFPAARIVGVIKKPIAATLEGGPWFDEWILHDRRRRIGPESFWDVVRRLRKIRPDVAVLFPNSFRSAWMAWLGGARRRVGYARGGRSWLLTDRVEPLRRDGRFVPTPMVGRYALLARTLGCRVESSRLRLETTPADEAAADRVWGRWELGDRVVTLNTGGAFGPAKNWPEGQFAELARRLRAEDGVHVLVLCGPAERSAARRIASEAGVASLANEPMSIGLSKACVRRSALLITTDSGPRHFAAAFGVPVLTLFGPTHVAWTRTDHPRALHIRRDVPCGPCQRPICPEGHHRCMRELGVDEVLAAARRLLGTGRVGAKVR